MMKGYCPQESAQEGTVLDPELPGAYRVHPRQQQSHHCPSSTGLPEDHGFKTGPRFTVGNGLLGLAWSLVAGRGENRNRLPG